MIAAVTAEELRAAQPSLVVGGPLAVWCRKCHVAPRVPCEGRKGPVRRCHAARLADAPPEGRAHVGDLLHVRMQGNGRGPRISCTLAQLLWIGAHVRVRLWMPGAETFARPRLLVASSVVRLATEDDARVAAARAYLAELVPRRPHVFDMKLHGRIWIVDADEAAVSWKAVEAEERGTMSRDTWERLALHGDVTPLRRKPGEALVQMVPSASKAEALAAAKQRVLAGMKPEAAPEASADSTHAGGDSWSHVVKPGATTPARKGW